MKEQGAEEVRRCLLCRSSESSLLVIGYDRMQAREEDYVYCRCVSCGLVALTPLPKPEEIPGLYPEHYLPHLGWRDRERDKLINRLAIKYFYGVASLCRSRLLRYMFRALSSRVMKGIREPHGANRLLDVGCGSGNLLERYQALGWSVRGIETSVRACTVCHERGLEVHQGTVFDAPFGRRQFDLILLNHVIEHVLDPIDVLKRVAEFLAPEGKLIVTTPNINGIGFSMYGSCWYQLDAPRHIVLFNPHTMQLLGQKAGLTMYKVVTRSVARILCESRHYAVTQGKNLPKDLARRKTILAESARAKQPYRGYRRLVSPLTLLFAMLGRGDIMEVEFALGTLQEARTCDERHQ